MPHPSASSLHELSRAEGPTQQTTRTDCKTSESPAWMVLRTPRVGGHAQSRPRNLRPTHPQPAVSPWPSVHWYEPARTFLNSCTVPLGHRSEERRVGKE